MDSGIEKSLNDKNIFDLSLSTLLTEKNRLIVSLKKLGDENYKKMDKLNEEAHKKLSDFDVNRNAIDQNNKEALGLHDKNRNEYYDKYIKQQKKLEKDFLRTQDSDIRFEIELLSDRIDEILDEIFELESSNKSLNKEIIILNTTIARLDNDVKNKTNALRQAERAGNIELLRYLQADLATSVNYLNEYIVDRDKKLQEVNINKQQINYLNYIDKDRRINNSVVDNVVTVPAVDNIIVPDVNPTIEEQVTTPIDIADNSTSLSKSEITEDSKEELEVDEIDNQQDLETTEDSMNQSVDDYTFNPEEEAARFAEEAGVDSTSDNTMSELNNDEKPLKGLFTATVDKAKKFWKQANVNLGSIVAALPGAAVGGLAGYGAGYLTTISFGGSLSAIATASAGLGILGAGIAGVCIYLSVQKHLKEKQARKSM